LECAVVGFGFKEAGVVLPMRAGKDGLGFMLWARGGQP
jgi:hypothetical protein